MKKLNSEKKSPLTKADKKTSRVLAVVTAFVLCFSCCTVAYAADDPLAVINNLSTFIFGLIRAVGLIILGFGIVQVGLSLKSHDPSQRANGFLTLAGGVVITFAKEILDLIVGKKTSHIREDMTAYILFVFKISSSNKYPSLYLLIFLF